MYSILRAQNFIWNKGAGIFDRQTKISKKANILNCIDRIDEVSSHYKSKIITLKLIQYLREHFSEAHRLCSCKFVAVWSITRDRSLTVSGLSDVVVNEITLAFISPLCNSDTPCILI